MKPAHTLFKACLQSSRLHSLSKRSLGGSPHAQRCATSVSSAAGRRELQNASEGPPVRKGAEVAAGLLKCVQVQASDPSRTVLVAFPRNVLCRETGLQLRDLRSIDPSFRNQLPAILARPSAVVVNLAHVRAIITALRAFVFAPEQDRVRRHLLPSLIKRLSDPPEDIAPPVEQCEIQGCTRRPTHGQFGRPAIRCRTHAAPEMLDLSRRMHRAKEEIPRESFEDGKYWLNQVGHPTGPAEDTRQQPFEFQALEVMLEDVCRQLVATNVELGNRVSKVYKAIVNKSKGQVSNKAEDHRGLLTIKTDLLDFQNHVSQIKFALQELLDNDEDLCNLYLTAKAAGGWHSRQNHEEVEELLEAYYRQVEEVASEASLAIHLVEFTELHLRTVLDSQRNELMRMDVLLNLGTFSIAAGGSIAALFGMNLLSGLEENPYAFWAASSVIAIISSSLFIAVYRFAKFRRKML